MNHRINKIRSATKYFLDDKNLVDFEIAFFTLANFVIVKSGTISLMIIRFVWRLYIYPSVDGNLHRSCRTAISCKFGDNQLNKITFKFQFSLI